jgi:hypothetical protein
MPRACKMGRARARRHLAQQHDQPCSPPQWSQKTDQEATPKSRIVARDFSALLEWQWRNEVKNPLGTMSGFGRPHMHVLLATKNDTLEGYTHGTLTHPAMPGYGSMVAGRILRGGRVARTFGSLHRVVPGRLAGRQGRGQELPRQNPASWRGISRPCDEEVWLGVRGRTPYGGPGLSGLSCGQFPATGGRDVPPSGVSNAERDKPGGLSPGGT